MKVGVIDYGMGNLASVSRAIETLGYEPVIAHHPDELRHVPRVILPGVGAFAEGMDRLVSGGWAAEIRRLVHDERRPVLGICLGMQFLADRGIEGGERQGLGLIPGQIVALGDLGCRERVPHVGWNELSVVRDDPLFGGIPDRMDYYFVHSFAFRPASPDDVLGTTPYGVEVTAAVRRGNVWGTQFHPEKSSKAGLQLMRNFIEHS